ncbi:MAG: hypothetical protein V1717_03685 [Candidatus Micrarchaeota archaeon]
MGVKRGQFAIELFLVLSLFALTLGWLNNYQTEFRRQDFLFASQKTLSSQLALLAGEAFALNETVSFELPCFVSEGKPVPIWIYAGGVNDDGSVRTGSEITVLSVVYASKYSAKTVFSVVPDSENPLKFDCNEESVSAGRIFFERRDDAVALFKGS